MQSPRKHRHSFIKPVLVGVMINLAWNAVLHAATRDDVKAQLQQFCVECHGDDDAAAGISFSSFDSEVDIWRDRSIWLRVRDALSQGDMPPEDASHELPAEQRKELLTWISRTLHHVDVSKIPKDAGRVAPRRLNRHEYRFTINDLFAIDYDPRSLLPVDQTEDDSFDNNAATLFTQPALIEKYVNAANQVCNAVWSNELALERLVFAVPEELARFSNTLPVVTSAQQTQRTNMGDGSFAVVTKFQTKQGGVLFSMSALDGEWRPDAKTLYIRGGHLAHDVGWLGNLETRYRVNDGQWHYALLNVVNGRAIIYADGKKLAERKMTRPDVKGDRFKIGMAGDDEEFPPFSGGQIASVRFYEQGLNSGDAKSLSEGKLIKQKPVYEWDAKASAKSAADQKPHTEASAAKTVLDRFLTQAFRRRITQDELQRYLSLYRHARSQGDEFHAALRLPVKAALVSPSFLFRSEQVKSETTAYRISPRELAIRMSYFLWSSMPDKRLMTLADDGQLFDPIVLRREVERMLADPKARRMSERFAVQWLRIEGLGTTVKPDPELFPTASPSLMRSMKQETILFVDSILRHDQPVLQLIQADHTYVDHLLARHYGVSIAQRDGMSRVTLRDSARGGLLTHASVLTVSSSPRRTSPVLRGKWILEVLLGQKPPPPPANVPSIDSADNSTPQGLREALKQHRNKPACNSCHKRIDPLGFALETFDPIGRKRTEKIDTRGQLPDGTSFDSHVDLIKHIVDNERGLFARQLAKKMLAYALGRELEFTDEAAIQHVLNELKKSDMRAASLFQSVVTSYPFQYRQEPKRQGVSPQ